jgi:hypothetical protein
MAYTISNTNGSVLTILADDQVDQHSTSLTLIGRNVNSYGQYYNNNLIQMLANSANTNANPPRSPLAGQLWYDTTNRLLNVYDGGFNPATKVSVASSQPGNLIDGNLWFDTQHKQLNVYYNGGVSLVGPVPNGFLSMSVDIEKLVNSTDYNYTGFATTATVALQNTSATNLLTKMFPPIGAIGPTTNVASPEGVVDGTHARVLFNSTLTDYQVRRFEVVSGAWTIFITTSSVIDTTIPNLVY